MLMQRSRTIWIVSENSFEGMELANHYKSLGHIVSHIYTQREAFTLVKREIPDLIILNPSPEDDSGIEFMQQLKRVFEKREVPFIFLSELDHPETIAKILNAGAFDYMRKPFSYIELDARVQSALTKKDIYQDLQEKNERLQKLSVTDSLTGLYNHRFLIEQLERSFNLLTRFNRPFSFIMLDIDHFKQINDQYGHITGDQVLIVLSNTLVSGRRNTDIVGRYGGEEFGLLLPEITSEKVEKVSKRIIRDIRNLILTPRHRPSLNISISVSLGVASCPDVKISNSEDVIHMADQALYKAKELGGNTIIQNRSGLFTEIKASL